MKIRLGTFNLFQFAEPPYLWYTRKGKFNARQWIEKTAWIKNQILHMDCDIIGFQEVFSQEALKMLVKELGFNYFSTVDTAKLSGSNKMKYVSTTVALASKYPISNIETVAVHLPSIQMHQLKEPFYFSRVPIKATITLADDTELLIYVCHLKSNRLNEFEYVFKQAHTLVHKKELISKALEGKYSNALRQRLCEASSLFFDINNEKEKPSILLCDLNDKEFSLTIDALSNPTYHDGTSEENLILYDANYEYKESIYNPHPEAKKAKRKATSYFLGRGNVLDYIFISNHFYKKNINKVGHVTNYSILDEHLQKNKNGSLLTSDHAQVVCELYFM